MLWLLSIAAKKKFRIDRYFDAALGVMEKNAGGKMAMTVVTRRPEVRFSGERLPTQAQIRQMHHEAHEQCFIANLP